MADTSKFKTAHQLARELLAGPDIMVVMPTPVFDMPGRFTAFPVKVEKIQVQGIDAVAILPDLDKLEDAEEPPITVRDTQSPPP